MIPPACVKPFVKRKKNEAAMRPTMRFVPVKGEETQGAAMVFGIRELLIRWRATNALRGHFGAFGQVVPKGAANPARPITIVEDLHIWWDGHGACMFIKRLEDGRFVWPSTGEGTVALTPAQLPMLLEGIDWRARSGPGDPWQRGNLLIPKLRIPTRNTVG